MTGIFEVTGQEIGRLDALQLTKLLKTLLYLETSNNELYESSSSVPLNINVPDDGEDGRVQWSGGPLRTSRLPARFTIFQSKAEQGMTPAQFGEAMLQKSAKSKSANTRSGSATPRSSNKTGAPERLLKPSVKEVLDSDGAYIFFCSEEINTAKCKLRIQKIREALKAAKRKDWQKAIVDIYDGTKIADWTNQFLPAVIRVYEWIGQDIPSGFQSWEEWRNYPEHKLFSFVDDEVDDQVRTLNEHFKEAKRVARVLGLPGLGKSRIAIEALSQPEELRQSVVYVDASMCSDNLADAIKQYRCKKSRATIVVDNCPLSLHQQLRREVAHDASNLSLLSIDFNPEERSGADATDPVIHLKQSSPRVIEALLTQYYGKTLPDYEIERIVKLADGFPRMAALIANARLSNKVGALSLDDDELLKRLVWGRDDPNQEAQQSISGCALFVRLGFESSAVIERIHVAEKFLNVDKDKFYKHAVGFIRRRILQKVGDFVMVVPRPLAIRLAADWWSECSPEKAVELMSDALPGNLTNALCEQIKMLDHLPEVKSLTKDLCGEQGPFGSAEVLKTERGSLLFRAFAEVSPQVAIETLERLYTVCSRQELLEVKESRRNIVRTLQFLCYRVETFSAAAKLLLNFAAAENESWSNNASGEFIQLFQLYLPGTQADYAQRVEIIESEIDSPHREKRMLALHAAAKAFESGSYSRMGGEQPAQLDYQPKTIAEMYDYWCRCIAILAAGATTADQDISSLAMQKIEGVVYPCVKRHFLKPLLNTIESVVSHKGIFWVRARQKFDLAMRQSAEKYTDEEQELINQIRSLLEPQSLEQKLSMWVSNASWDYVRQVRAGNFVDDSVNEARELAAICADNWNTFKPHLPLLLEGSQKNTWAFGSDIAEKTEAPEEVIQDILNALRGIGPKGNPSLLMGVFTYLTKKEPQLVAQSLDLMAADDTLVSYLVPVTVSVNPTWHDFDRCLDAYLKQKICVSSFQHFLFGSSLANLSSVDIRKLAAILSTEKPEGQWIALEVLNSYCHGFDNRWNDLVDMLSNLIVTINLLDRTSFDPSEIHTWGDLCSRLLSSVHHQDIAKYIIEQIALVCETEKDKLFYQLDRQLQGLLAQILTAPYVISVWPVFAELLLSENWRIRHNIDWLLSKSINGLGDDGTDLIGLVPETLLLDWAASSDQAARKLAKLVPMVVETKEPGTNILKGTLHPLAEKLINLYGTDDQVLGALSRFSGPTGWVGSETPHIQSKIEVLRSLAHHRLPSVKKWARKLLAAAQSNLVYSQKRDEEHSKGIFDKL